MKEIIEKILGISLPPHHQTRLRHVFYLGIKMEEQSEIFYKNFEETADDPDTKQLCSELAEEETQHQRVLEGILSHWQQIPVTDKDLKAIDADGRLSKLFTDPPATDTSTSELLKYAIKEEEKMIKFYANFETEFHSAWKLLKLQDMQDEEKTHIDRLYSRLTKA